MMVLTNLNHVIVSNMMLSVIVYNVLMEFHDHMMLKDVNVANAKIHVATINVEQIKIVPLIFNLQHNMVQNSYRYVGIVQSEADVHMLLIILAVNVNVTRMLTVAVIQNVALLAVVLFVFHQKQNIDQGHQPKDQKKNDHQSSGKIFR